MTSINTDRLLEGLKAYGLTPEIAAKIDSFKAHPRISTGAQLIELVCAKVEATCTDSEEFAGASGSEKKAAVKKYMDDVIELPALLEWVDDIVIGAAIDWAIRGLNSEHGKNWIEKVRSIL